MTRTASARGGRDRRRAAPGLNFAPLSVDAVDSSTLAMMALANLAMSGRERPTRRIILHPGGYRARVDAESFWRIVDGTLADSDRQLRLLEAALAVLTADEVLGFRRQFIAAHRRAYTHVMWLAAALRRSHPGGKPDLGEDGFTDFRSWLISRGSSVFARAVDDPDTIIDIPDDDSHDMFCHGESFAEVADEVYQELSGDAVPVDEDIVELLGEPSGPSVNLGTVELSAQFPRLMARRQRFRT